jgi:GNAT superfamily N-acetyltransferase
MAGEAFQYPDHPEWSVQSDEVESISASMKNYRRIWPIIRLLQWLSPPLRDIIDGHVWEEESKIVGFTNLSRQGTTDLWYVSGVGVSPGYRRRGIARQLVNAGLDLVRARGGRLVLLDVIDGNEPAYKLYQSLGFETYTGTLALELESPSALPALDLPKGYTQEVVSPFEWQPRYSLAQRITPEHVLTYEPVEERRYRRPPIARLMMPLFLKADGLKAECFTVQTRSGQVVAHGRGEARTREKGRNEITVRLDPEHPDLAPYLIQYLVRWVEGQSPGRIVETWLPEWQSDLAEAAKDAGFAQRTRNHRMGLVL